MNPRYLDPPITATALPFSQYANLRHGTRQTPAPAAHRLFQPFTRQLDADRLRQRVAVAARLLHSTVGKYGLIWLHPHPSFYLVVARP